MEVVDDRRPNPAKFEGNPARLVYPTIIIEDLNVSGWRREWDTRPAGGGFARVMGKFNSCRSAHGDCHLSSERVLPRAASPEPTRSDAERGTIRVGGTGSQRTRKSARCRFPERVPVQLAVTQPYDKITPAMQERYYQASPYNLVRIILGKPLPTDGDAENVYTRAAASFHNWRQTGVLRRDPEPSLYLYSQTFRLPGDVPGSVPGGQASAEQRGFIALGRIEEYSAGVLFLHQQTLAKPKADRLDLLRVTRAHFGQIFVLYSGAGKVDALLDSAATKDKDIDIEVTAED